MHILIPQISPLSTDMPNLFSKGSNLLLQFRLSTPTTRGIHWRCYRHQSRDLHPAPHHCTLQPHACWGCATQYFFSTTVCFFKPGQLWGQGRAPLKAAILWSGSPELSNIFWHCLGELCLDPQCWRVTVQSFSFMNIYSFTQDFGSIWHFLMMLPIPVLQKNL